MDVFPTLFLEIIDTKRPFENEKFSSDKHRKDLIQTESIIH